MRNLKQVEDGKISFQTLVNRFLQHNIPLASSPLHIQIEHAKEKVEYLLDNLLPDGYEWLLEYERIIEWLSDNKHKGLLFMGNCGRGKTLFACKIIPMILNMEDSRKIYNYTDAVDINRNIDTLKNRTVLILDDIGVEDVYVNFGERRYVFNELVDNAEKTGQLLIVTTNLDYNSFLNKYDYRTLDRLLKLTDLIQFSGPSLRAGKILTSTE